MQVKGRQIGLEMSCSIYQVEWELKKGLTRWFGLVTVLRVV